MRSLVLALCAMLALPATGFALQDDMIVVTGSRLRNTDNLTRAPQTSGLPHIHVVRRADNYVVTVELLSDTRERETRRAEVRATLEGLLARAENASGITVAMMGDGLIDLDPDMIGQIDIAEHPHREDVSHVTLYLKTPISQGDNFDDADNRIASFVASLQASGRAAINPSPSYSLTLTGGADQYRDDVVRAIASDVRFLRTTFGNEYEVNVQTSLHDRVRLTQSGPLELSIYLPYTATVMLRRQD